ncbi:MAG: GNAT family N-acetyltransferase [Mesotoga sp.]|nr:GNAT family N-acetyltransferase [Mesotoga sp.]
MIERVTEGNMKDFLSYCQKYGGEHDDSYLPGDDFAIDEDHPSYLLYDEDRRVCGASSLMLEERYRRARKGRFMIFHSTQSGLDGYRGLLEAILAEATEAVRSVYLFVPPGPEIQRVLERLGFEIERYSFVMQRKMTDFEIPVQEGISFVAFNEREHRELYCRIVNSAFKKIAGHIDIRPEWVSAMIEKYNIPAEGIQLLYFEGTPAGLFFSEITEDGMLEIGPIAVLPEYQGRGLGRTLLRRAVQLSQRLGLDSVLSVNAENEKALSLYLKEGFTKVDTRICYGLNLNP